MEVRYQYNSWKKSTLLIFLAIILPNVCRFRNTGVTIVFQEKLVCKGFINIKTNSKNKRYMLISSWVVLTPLPPTCHYCPNAFGHGENTNSTTKCHLNAKVLCTVEGKRLSNEMENKDEGVADTKSFGTHCPWSPESPDSCRQERTLRFIPNCSLGASPERWFFRRRCKVSDQRFWGYGGREGQ